MWVSILVRHGDGCIGFCCEVTSEMGQGSTNAESDLASLQTLRGSGTDIVLLWAPVILSLPASGGHCGAGLCESVSWSEPSLDSLLHTQSRC